MVETILSTQEAFGTVTRIQVPIALREVFIAEATEDILALAEYVEGDLLIVTSGGFDWRYGGF